MHSAFTNEFWTGLEAVITYCACAVSVAVITHWFVIHSSGFAHWSAISAVRTPHISALVALCAHKTPVSAYPYCYSARVSKRPLAVHTVKVSVLKTVLTVQTIRVPYHFSTLVFVLAVSAFYER